MYNKKLFLIFGMIHLILVFPLINAFGFDENSEKSFGFNKDNTLGNLNNVLINSPLNNQTIIYNFTSGLWYNAFINTTGGGSGNLSGFGTLHYLSKFSDSNTLTDSIIYNNGNFVGINTTTPYGLGDIFNVNGEFTLHQNGDNYFQGYTDVTGQTTFQIQTNEKVILGDHEGSSTECELSIHVPEQEIYTQFIKKVTFNNIPADLTKFGLNVENPQVEFHMLGDSILGGNVTINTLDIELTSDYVLVEDGGKVKKAEIDGKVWENSLIDGSGSANKIPYFSDSDTLTYNTLFNWDNTNKRLGIGIETPEATLHVVGTEASGYFDRIESTTNSPALTFRKARGSVGSESIVSVADNLGAFTFRGYGATRYRTGARFGAGIDTGTISDDSMPGFLYFQTTPNGTRTPVERMRIDNAGNIGLNTIAPTEKLEVSGNVKATAFIGDGSQLTGIGGGNPFDQSLNTTNDVSFNVLNTTNKFHSDASTNYTYFDFGADIGICWNLTHIIWGESITGQCG